MLFRSGLLLAGISMPALAGQVNLGSIGVWPGSGASDGYPLIVLSNQSGLLDQFNQPLCPTADATSGALSCDAVTLTDWSLEVDYTTLGGGALLQQLAAHNSSATCGVSGCDTIISGNDSLGSPLYALPYSDALVTRIVFKASLPSPITIWNPGDTVSSSFFLQSPFTFTIDIPPNDAYALGQSPYFLTSLIISDAPGPGPVPDVPEPASLILVFGGLLATIARRYRHKA